MPLSARTIGYGSALLALMLDQALKLWALFVLQIDQVMAQSGPIPLTSFFDLVLVWNRGISYGLFQQNSALGRLILIGIALVASLFLAVWIWRNRSALVGLGLGLVLGGAAANGIDRIGHGAVVDLFHFHLNTPWGPFSWYVFNLADTFIVVGAAILIFDSVRDAGLFGRSES